MRKDLLILLMGWLLIAGLGLLILPGCAGQPVRARSQAFQPTPTPCPYKTLCWLNQEREKAYDAYETGQITPAAMQARFLELDNIEKSWLDEGVKP